MGKILVDNIQPINVAELNKAVTLPFNDCVDLGSTLDKGSAEIELEKPRQSFLTNKTTDNQGKKFLTVLIKKKI